VLGLRTEETSLRVEPVLATAVSRLRWTASHLAFTGIGPVVVLAGALAQLPAVWLLAAVAVALVGLAPPWSGVGDLADLAVGTGCRVRGRRSDRPAPS
jgi:ABC-2 type transport system permease protein